MKKNLKSSTFCYDKHWANGKYYADWLCEKKIPEPKKKQKPEENS